MRAWLALAAGLLFLGAGCARGPASGVAADPSRGVEVVSSESVLEFYERATFFYERMARRRFNTLATYEDRALRKYFRSESSFSDYYADLATELAESHFEKNRPLSLTVEEFLVDGPGRARVRVRIVGENGLPLRFWETVLEREDRWVRLDGQWWIVPGRL